MTERRGIFLFAGFVKMLDTAEGIILKIAPGKLSRSLLVVLHCRTVVY